LTQQGLQADPLSGDLYVFISRRATMMKVLYFDRSGFCIWAKKLEAGCFVSDWSQVRTQEMDWTALKLMLEGIEPGRLRKRYRLPKPYQKTASNTSSLSANSLQCTDGTRVTEQAPERG
jgi:transposase